jgi:hypothetical protein
MSSLNTNSMIKAKTKVIPVGILEMQPIEVPAPAYHTPDIPTAYTCMARKGGIMLSHGSSAPENCTKASSFRLNEFQYCCVPKPTVAVAKKK